jgi:hypothetical protein
MTEQSHHRLVALVLRNLTIAVLLTMNGKIALA